MCTSESQNTPKAINNGSACSVLLLNTTGLFPAHRKAGNNPGELKNSIEHADPLFITSRLFS